MNEKTKIKKNLAKQKKTQKQNEEQKKEKKNRKRRVKEISRNRLNTMKLSIRLLYTYLAIVFLNILTWRSSFPNFMAPSS